MPKNNNYSTSNADENAKQKNSGTRENEQTATRTRQKAFCAHSRWNINKHISKIDYVRWTHADSCYVFDLALSSSTLAALFSHFIKFINFPAYCLRTLDTWFSLWLFLLLTLTLIWRFHFFFSLYLHIFRFTIQMAVFMRFSNSIFSAQS